MFRMKRIKIKIMEVKGMVKLMVIRHKLMEISSQLMVGMDQQGLMSQKELQKMLLEEIHQLTKISQLQSQRQPF